MMWGTDFNFVFEIIFYSKFFIQFYLSFVSLTKIQRLTGFFFSFIFFYIHKKKVLDSRKFSTFTFFYTHKKKVLNSLKLPTSGFWWIFMIWDVLNTIWSFLENVCLSVGRSVGRSVCMSPKFCGHPR